MSASARAAPRPGVVFAAAEDARERARRRLPRLVFDFVDGGAGDEAALRANEADLRCVRLMPRVLREVRGGDLSKTFLGTRHALPFGIAPMGMCDLAWPGTDRAFAETAARFGMPVAVSTASSTPLEAMIERAGGRAWFQLYVTGSAEAAIALAGRAAAAGYGTLLLTVDVPVLGRRPRDLRNGFATPFRMRPRHVLDFAMHPRWSLSTLAAGVPRMANYDADPSSRGYDRTAARAGADWAFLDRLRALWKGRLIVKGVLSPEDAARIAAAGADAIYVSNHGGRQLSAAPSTIAALAGVREAVGPGFPLVLDGGVRSGEDIVRALASGADFVMLGRPFLFAAAAAGPSGVAGFTETLVSDLSATLAQVGLVRIEDVSGAILAP